MNTYLAKTDAEILECYPVIKELRPHISEDGFVQCVRRQEEGGYRLLAVKASDAVVAVAGFRTGENLAWGRFLYVDDMVTAEQHRSKGYGAVLLSWLQKYALSEGCQQLRLDSGQQRLDAHRFYEREGLSKTGFHFAQNLIHP